MCSLDSFTVHEDAKDAWDFLVDLAEKTREWESTQENERSHGGKGFYVEGLVAKEAHLDSLIKRFEVLVTKEPNPVHQVSQVPMCNWCQSPGHVMEECPNTSGGNNHENVSALSLNNPYSNTYNPGWRNHPNFSWTQGNRAGPSNFQSQGLPSPQRPNFAPHPNFATHANFGPQGPQVPQVPQGPQVPQVPQIPQVPSFLPHQNCARPPALASYQLPLGFTNTGEAARISELEKSMALLMSSHNTVERQLSQIVTLLHEKEKGTLPSQPETNPRHQAQIQQGTPPRLNQIPNPQRPGPSGDCHMISALRSGREYQQASVPHSSPVDTPVAPIPVKASSEPPPLGLSDKPEENKEETSDRAYVPKAPFPSRLANNKKAKNVEKILEVLKQVQVNIPLLDAVAQVPAYAKVLKDLCTQKRATTVPKKAFLAAHISSPATAPKTCCEF
ncbi:hypothetical protein MRB53_035130 [Persea americana]|uniref:Uncharacterized protein n=1 Tax=Persea americana TaxID=3435 RepID=A0ACC2K3T5_PERAE|nr:hypothetical protein MRB53_035130 [Persea americana]